MGEIERKINGRVEAHSPREFGCGLSRRGDFGGHRVNKSSKMMDIASIGETFY